MVLLSNVENDINRTFGKWGSFYSKSSVNNQRETANEERRLGDFNTHKTDWKQMDVGTSTRETEKS